MASRHLSRIAALQALFAADARSDFSYDALATTWEANTDSLAHDDEDRAFTETLLKGVSAKHDEIDAVMQKAAPQWPLEKIASIDRNVLRIGLYELLYGSEVSVPPKVALNEAIELAKTFGGDSSPKFVNGVLGAVYRDMGTPRKDEAPKTIAGHEHAAGMVVCAHEKEVWYVALILDSFNTWTIPKSAIRDGELSEAAAFRAAREELGIPGVDESQVIAEHAFDIRDKEKGIVEKQVGYFVGVTQKVRLSPKKKSSVQDARWFSESELDDLVLYDDLRGVVESGIVAAKGLAQDHG